MTGHYFLCEHCGNEIGLNIAKLDSDGLWTCVACMARAEARQARNEFIEGMVYAFILLALIVLAILAFCQHMNRAIEEERIEPTIHMRLAVPDNEIASTGNAMDTPGEFAAEYRENQFILEEGDDK